MLAFELGFEKAALNPMVMPILGKVLGYGLAGAGVGALAAGEGNRLKGALYGGLGGALVPGALGAAFTRKPEWAVKVLDQAIRRPRLMTGIGAATSAAPLALGYAGGRMARDSANQGEATE